MPAIVIAFGAAFAAISTVIAHRSIGRKWADNELARRGVGWVIVLIPTGIGCAVGVLDWHTWLAFVFAAGTAGAVLFIERAAEERRDREARLQWLRERVMYGDVTQGFGEVGEPDSGGD